MRLVKLSANGSVQWSKYYSANKYNGRHLLLCKLRMEVMQSAVMFNHISNGSSGSFNKDRQFRKRNLVEENFCA